MTALHAPDSWKLTGARLVIPVVPKNGEGLPDLVFRAAAENGYSTTHSLLEIAGMDGRYPAGIATRAINHEDDLARTLGIPGGADQLRRLLYLPVPERKGWHQFFGAGIRLAHREVLRRRVSPQALRQSPHGKAIWSIKIFSFDPKTKEQLLEACPECGQRLGYTRTWGVAFCHACTVIDNEGFRRGGVDLRDYPQPCINVADTEGLDLVTGLIDPDEGIRGAFRPNLPDCLRSYNRGALFEFAVALACAMTADPLKTTAFLPRPGSRQEYARFKPDVVARAGRIMLDWPSGFHALARELRSSAESRAGHFGIKKELGPLLALRIDPHIEPGLRELARLTLEGDMARTSTGLTMVRRKENLFREDLLTVERAAHRFKTSRKTLARIAHDPRVDAQRAGSAEKAPILLSESVFARVLERRNHYLPRIEAAKSLGIPAVAINSLIRANHLDEEADPIGLAPGRYLLRSSVEHLTVRLARGASPTTVPDGAISIAKLATLMGAPILNPWPSLFSLRAEEQIPAWDVNGGCWTQRIMFASLVDVRNKVQPIEWDGSDFQKLTTRDAALLIGTHFPVIYSIINMGLLPRDITLESLQEFSRTHMWTWQALWEIAEHRKCPAAEVGRNELLAMGIRPSAEIRDKKLRLWNRQEVMASLDR